MSEILISAKNSVSQNLVSHINAKIKSLKDEKSAIEYTMLVDKVISGNDDEKVNACIHKIQVLNEVLISFGVQKEKITKQ